MTKQPPVAPERIWIDSAGRIYPINPDNADFDSPPVAYVREDTRTRSLLAGWDEAWDDLEAAITATFVHVPRDLEIALRQRMTAARSTSTPAVEADKPVIPCPHWDEPPQGTAVELLDKLGHALASLTCPIMDHQRLPVLPDAKCNQVWGLFWRLDFALRNDPLAPPPPTTQGAADLSAVTREDARHPFAPLGESQHCIHITGNDLVCGQPEMAGIHLSDDIVDGRRVPFSRAADTPTPALYDDSDPVMAALSQVADDGDATDNQRRVARSAMKEIKILRGVAGTWNRMLNDRRPTPTESEEEVSRSVLCVWCGTVVYKYNGPPPAANESGPCLAAAREHDPRCPKNPLVIQVASLTRQRTVLREALGEMSCTCPNPDGYYPHNAGNPDCNLSIAAATLATPQENQDGR